MQSKLIIIFFLFMGFNLSSQNFWEEVSENSILPKSNAEREIIPENYRSFKLNINKLEKHLFRLKSNHKATIELPLPDGKMSKFLVYENTCMSPVLAEKFPEIKSFDGYIPDNPYEKVKLDFGPMGFHASISSMKGTIYIDPFFTFPDEHYISYYVKDHKVDTSQFSGTCGTDHYLDQIKKEEKKEKAGHFPIQKSRGPEVLKHKYRLALATTGEWGQRWDTKEATMARVVTGVNRINMIFENEVATTFELIDNNDELIFIDPLTDPYENANQAPGLLGQNNLALNNIVGSNSYDIGHVFTIFCNSGIAGIASLGSVCLNSKGQGVSCVGNANISNFMVNTTAHEIGHQFNGGHSWSNCPNAQGQLSPGTAWEPGSGSTILSYAGSCGSQNISGNNDDYFHVGNVEQFQRFIANTGRCAESVLSGNHAPDIEVGIGDGLYIPIATPFELEGTAMDEDGDVLTYNWEQMDLGPVSSLGDPAGNAPSFRSFPPTTNPKRLFPRLSAIIGSVGSALEVLPLYSRDLTFRFTVRDNHPGAGVTVWEEIEFEATDSAGPFRVTEPNSLTFVEVGQELNVEWDVANTDNELVNCQFVDIYLSLDNAQSFPILLAEQTPNDGSEIITIPNELTNEGKIKVKAHNHIFFQFNRSNIIIREPANPGFYINIDQSEFDVCLPDVVEMEISGTSFQEFDNPVELSVEGLPENANFSFSNNPFMPSTSSTLSVDLQDVEYTDQFEFRIIGIAQDADTIEQVVKFNVTGTQFNDLVLDGPENGVDKIQQTPIFSWTESRNADTYKLEIATNPSFGSFNVVEEAFLLDTFYGPPIVLDNSQLYYWRVSAQNGCVESPTPIRTFGTINLDCKSYEASDLPKNITFSGSVQVDATAKVFDIGTVADVNVTKIKGTHTNVFQLKGSLISPAGTEAVMFDNTCFASTDFNIGFDSDSPLDFICPLNSGLTLKPGVDDLTVFNGENIDGDWTFRIDDSEGGDGGQFSEFELELCASFEVDDPFIVNNELLEIPTGLSGKIKNLKLLVNDNTNSPDQLVYTLVIAPQKGSLLLNGESMQVGDQFTQEDINNEFLRYNHEGAEDASDFFEFTVIDGDGGWLDLTRFDISMSEDFVSSTEENVLDNNILIYPNPAYDWFKLVSLDEPEILQITLYSLDGTLLLRKSFNKEMTLSTEALDSGLYFINIANKSASKSFKINVIK